jgi:hydrogenase maturation protein HypF
MSARSILVSGVVRAWVFAHSSIAWRANTLAGWVLNGEEGVEIYLEGAEPALDGCAELGTEPPPAARQPSASPRPSPRV